ncbi:MAG: polyprenyl synthetase family protein [Candidatus Margulisbacteria bacterium]|nr:polyprenyl synthetase family protein [Candidatus Margulisiibacteriota bacterium]
MTNDECFALKCSARGDELRNVINKELKKYLPKKGKLAKAMRYSVFAGGKRFRPILCLLTAKALGKNYKKVLPIACAIEMLHTFTLIHDDLPAMDNSNYRRGKLTCHKKFDEATAILAGDALNTLAFDVLAKETKNPLVVSEIADALMKVVVGQVMDIESEGKKVNLKQLKTIHQNKTAALLIACVRASALQLKASSNQLRALTQYAGHLGLAFQIADDILDVTSTKKQLGKPVKADLKKGFPYLMGVEKSKKMAEIERKKAIKALNIFGNKAMFLREIASYVIKREK